MIALYGASGHGKVILDSLTELGLTDIVFVDDNPALQSFQGLMVIRMSALDPSVDVIISVGNNRTRKAIASRLPNPFTNAIHPRTILSKSVQMGIGTVVMPGAVVNVDSAIGDHVIINTSASIDHDCVVENFAHISPNATLAGGVRIGEGSWVGMGAVIMQGVTIGRWATIGAGSVITKDIPDHAVVVGVPGKIIKYNDVE